VHFWLARHYAWSGSPQTALTHLQASRSGAPSELEARLVAARIHYRLGQWASARAALDEAQAHGGERHGRFLALRGLVELEESGPEAAAPWLEKAEARMAYHPEVIDALATFATRRGDKDKIAAYQQRRKQFEENLAKITTLQKKLVELHSQPRPDPVEKQTAAYQLGTMLFQIGEDETAVKWMASVLKENPAHVEAHQALAAYYERIGDAHRAEEHRRQAQARKGG
jgi:tetratricopeptide (TPR) repeat protein